MLARRRFRRIRPVRHDIKPQWEIISAGLRSLVQTLQSTNYDLNGFTAAQIETEGLSEGPPLRRGPSRGGRGVAGTPNALWDKGPARKPA